jgi:hypothetical protein
LVRTVHDLISRYFSCRHSASVGGDSISIDAELVPRANLDAIVQQPAQIRHEFELRATLLRKQLGAWGATIGGDGLGLVFSAFVASALKPYGRGCPNCDLASILQASHLDCSNHSLLTIYLARLCVEGLADHFALRVVGWQGPVVGNHQMIFAEPKRHSVQPYLALEPTFGIAAKGTYDHIARGMRITPADIASMPSWRELSTGRNSMIALLREGQFRPSDLLFYFEDVEHYLQRFGSVAQWPTPGAANWRAVFGRGK